MSGYVPEEIWKKAGEPTLITQTHILPLAFSLSRCRFFEDTLLCRNQGQMSQGWKWMRGAPLNPILPSRPDVGCRLQLPIHIDLNYCVKLRLENHLYLIQ